MTFVTNETFQLIPVGPDEAPLVAKVFRSVYGENYIDSSVYQPEKLLQKMSLGQLFGILALTSDGQAAGYVALGATAPNAFLLEEKGLVVVPEYSHTNIGTILACYFGNPATWPAKTIGVFATAVCNHYFTQVICEKANWIASAVQLDIFDLSIFRDSAEKNERLSCSLFFSSMPPQPGFSYWPIEYCGILQTITAARQEPGGRISTAPIPVDTLTSMNSLPISCARTWTIHVFQIGADWPVIVERILTEARRQEVISIQMFIDTACPHIGAAVQILNSQGFFLGGIASRWFGTDGLLMQQVFVDTIYEEIKLYSGTAKELLGFIREERLKIRQEMEKNDVCYYSKQQE